MLRSLLEHSLKSIFHYRMTAVYFIAGVVLTTAHIPFTRNELSPILQATQHSYSNPVVPNAPSVSSLRLDFGQPPVLFINIAYHLVAAWFSFLGIFWDVRRRMREWTLIRLCGRHPSLIAGFQYSCLALLGLIMGGGISFLIALPHSMGHTLWTMMATAVWGFLFSFCIFAGPIAYTEFFDVVPVLRLEGEVR